MPIGTSITSRALLLLPTVELASLPLLLVVKLTNTDIPASPSAHKSQHDYSTASRQVRQPPTNDENEEEEEEEEGAGNDDYDDNNSNKGEGEVKNDENDDDDKEETVEQVVEPEINSDNVDTNEDNKSLVPIAAFTEGATVSQLSNLRYLTLHRRTNVHIAIKPPPNALFIPRKERSTTNSINLSPSTSSSSHATSKGKAKRTLMRPTAAATVW